MQVSFSSKIPIGNCNLYDNKEKKFVKATLYEIDCKDKSDVDYVKNLPEPWSFRRYFISDIWHNHYLFSQRQENSSKKIYSIETPDGYITALCDTEAENDSVNIEYIETSPSKRYKFSGQTMLAAVAKQLIGKEKNLTVENPAYEAINFYKNVCEFDKDAASGGFVLPKGKIQDFVSRTEIRTNGLISEFA